MIGAAPSGLDHQTLTGHKPTATPIWFLGLHYPLNRILMLSVMRNVTLGNGSRHQRQMHCTVPYPGFVSVRISNLPVTVYPCDNVFHRGNDSRI